VPASILDKQQAWNKKLRGDRASASFGVEANVHSQTGRIGQGSSAGFLRDDPRPNENAPPIFAKKFPKIGSVIHIAWFQLPSRADLIGERGGLEESGDQQSSHAVLRAFLDIEGVGDGARRIVILGLGSAACLNVPSASVSFENAFLTMFDPIGSGDLSALQSEECAELCGGEDVVAPPLRVIPGISWSGDDSEGQLHPWRCLAGSRRENLGPGFREGRAQVAVIPVDCRQLSRGNFSGDHAGVGLLQESPGGRSKEALIERPSSHFHGFDHGRVVIDAEGIHGRGLSQLASADEGNRALDVPLLQQVLERVHGALQHVSLFGQRAIKQGQRLDERRGQLRIGESYEVVEVADQEAARFLHVQGRRHPVTVHAILVGHFGESARPAEPVHGCLQVRFAHGLAAPEARGSNDFSRREALGAGDLDPRERNGTTSLARPSRKGQHDA